MVLPLPTATKPIFSKLQTKLALQQTNNPKLYLADMIMPVVDVDFILATTKVYTTSTSAASRADTYTCPLNKFWKIKNFNIDRVNAASNQIMIIVDGTTVELHSAVTNQVLSYNGQDIKIKGGDSAYFNCGTGTSGVIVTNLVVEEYDA